MAFIKSYYPLLSTLVFVVFIVIAHICSSETYDWTKHSISHLGAQGYDRKIMMQTGFVLFGLIFSIGLLMNGLHWRTAPMLIYGLCILLTGIFCAAPYIEQSSYSITQANLHSIFAQIAGIAFCIGILLQIQFAKDHHLKWIHLLFFMLIVGLSASFGLLKNHQGIVQRLLYLTSFIWLIQYYKT